MKSSLAHIFYHCRQLLLKELFGDDFQPPELHGVSVHPLCNGAGVIVTTAEQCLIEDDRVCISLAIESVKEGSLWTPVGLTFYCGCIGEKDPTVEIPDGYGEYMCRSHNGELMLEKII